MLKEKRNMECINEKEFTEALSTIRSFTPEKRMFALAFINGMEFQRSISEPGGAAVKEISR